MSHQPDPEMVNISSDTVVRALEGIGRFDDVESQQLLAALTASVGGPIQLVPTKIPEKTEILQNTIRQVIAERLILGDRSLPLVDRSRVAEILRSVMAVHPELVEMLEDEEGVRLLDAALDAFVETNVKDVDTESQHENTWKRIHAFLALEAEIGPLDPGRQDHRDEFIRRSVTPEEWSRSTGKSMGEVLAETMGAMRTRLLPMLQQILGVEVSPEELEQEWGELEQFMEPLIRQATATVQARRDERFIQLWTIPMISTD